MRLDSWIGEKLSISRHTVQKFLKSTGAQVNNRSIYKPSYILKPLQTIDFEWQLKEETQWQEVLGELEIVYHNKQLICLNKPSGLVMYPGAGREEDSLTQRLLHAFPEAKALPRHGIIHRLDKETSGLVVFARTAQAHKSLLQIWFHRQVAKTYLCICHGNPKPQVIEKAIGRHPVDRKKNGCNLFWQICFK